ncbi:hypothetical protein [Paracidovorax avenae]|uniref:hypothetical protein n=1 Tax=Paracidovorax avenae TaxID=80867 RepID=UPI001260346E|nr:hypothetical protein [Paracidovorax avenae]
MWNTVLTRKELVELVIGARKIDDLSLTRVTGIQPGGDQSLFYAYWQEQPSAALPMPSLLVAPANSVVDLLVALNASPIAPSPVTALCRIVTREEASDLFQDSLLDTKHDVSVAVLALAIAEAVLLADGRLAPRQATPAICKRTLSYAWGKGLSMQLPPQLMQELPQRWAETYAGLNVSAAQSSFQPVVTELMGPLGICAHLAMGLQPPGTLGELAYSTFHGNANLQQQIWQRLSIQLDEQWSLRDIAAATREERGLYLQSALKLLPQSASVQRDERIAVCAFLATLVAPGSLEHLELLKINGTPGMVLWYALFAALQAPIDIVTGLPGVGQRVLRELAATSDPVGRPTADIAFSELRVLERVGIETMARRFGHVGEVEVELVPCVTSSFSLHGRNRARPEPEQLPLEVEQPTVSPKARMQQLIGLLADTLLEIPEDRPLEPDYSKKAYSANKRSRSKSEPR